MNSLVVYSSKTGNTKKLADALFEALEGEKEIFPIADAPDPDGYDLIAVGFWLMAGKPDPQSTQYLEKIREKNLFLFATHGAANKSDHARNALKTAGELAAGSRIVGSYNCQGEVNPRVLEKVKAKPSPPVWLDDVPGAVGHPDASDITEIKRLASSLDFEG
ncbi:Flavodoxin [Candidatus Desulfarcum epimagneticum]|uniref:Flavodoxin n=1 Tax=uncultured Desulfobacteraceae bacterium TaxID=218296 RepID=A0A484HQ00_9BACT|nr:Flavodoxin [uncultured Desulfobacteraceae bacterium]